MDPGRGGGGPLRPAFDRAAVEPGADGARKVRPRGPRGPRSGAGDAGAMEGRPECAEACEAQSASWPQAEEALHRPPAVAAGLVGPVGRGGREVPIAGEGFRRPLRPAPTRGAALPPPAEEGTRPPPPTPSRSRGGTAAG